MPRYKVPSKLAGRRLDVFVASKLAKFSRSSLRVLFKRSLVKLNDQQAKAGQRLRAGDTITVDIKPLKGAGKPLKLDIVYKDDDVLVVNKPAGTLTHSKGALNLEPTVASSVVGELTGYDDINNRAGIVHRLDRQTSGLMIIARHPAALANLQRQFANRQVIKEYLAIVKGEMHPPAALIDLPIQRHPKRPQTFRVNSTGRQAQTEYQTMKLFYKNSQPYSLIKLQALTGRTHQLRVHLTYLGHPIVGDSLYGQGGGPMLLHAQKLKLRLCQ